MPDRVNRCDLSVDSLLAAFIEGEALIGSGISAAEFWVGLNGLLTDFTPRNRALLARRDDLQRQIDDWHRDHAALPHDAAAYKQFLVSIGYLVPEGPDFAIETSNIDPEISTIAGPQLVVPVMNARYALNAANARWGNLYDALYGTDALGDVAVGHGYDADRGARVIAWVREFLDVAVPLALGLWRDVTALQVKDGIVLVSMPAGVTGLANPTQFVGYDSGKPDRLAIMLRHHQLLLEIIVDRATTIGQLDRAGISAVWLEAAISAIMDLEDSVAAVDGADKVVCYRNWLGLMKGNLSEDFSKGGKTMTRRLDPDYALISPKGGVFTAKGRALMLVRNVGHFLTNPAVRDQQGRAAPEGLLDALITVLCALHDLKKPDAPRNSTAGSVYVVKPKMHGPDEVAFADDVFSRVEQILGLPRYCVKLGIMDEERRTTVNLKECIRAARHRVAFINTGFLDRTGDEIHTSMQAGAMVRKDEMKSAKWIAAYENNNVNVGLACGLAGRAQIGKGIWAMPDLMAAMLRDKIAHPGAGANCAWVPSPTAAVLHATHYHRVDVASRQNEIRVGANRAALADILTIPVAIGRNWSEAEITEELENNAQGILGYVVRWVDQGIGCSKVPDIHNVQRMEDRATCRISSQHMANWLYHGVVSPDQVTAVMQRMALVVDGQNAADPQYHPMAPGFDGPAYLAACALVFEGVAQPNGYTEPIMQRARQAVKAARRSGKSI